MFSLTERKSRGRETAAVFVPADGIHHSFKNWFDAAMSCTAGKGSRRSFNPAVIRPRRPCAGETIPHRGIHFPVFTCGTFLYFLRAVIYSEVTIEDSLEEMNL